MFRKTVTVAVAAITLGAGVTVPAYAKPIVTQQVQPVTEASLVQAQYYDRRDYRRAQRRAERDARGCYRGEPLRDCRERTNWERRYGSRYYYNNGRYYRNDNSGAALAAGILGFALGAAIQGDRDDYDYYYARRNNRAWIERCRVRYRSFDPYSGTYVTTSGYRRYCRL